jgi:hypothetical protein
MSYTLGEAAKATGKSKTTIKRALEKSRISGRKGDTGEWQIEPVELHRVYPMVKDGTVPGGTPDSTPGNSSFQAQLNAAAREIALLEMRAAEKDEVISDLRQDRDHWRRQATALLEGPPPTTQPRLVGSAVGP